MSAKASSKNKIKKCKKCNRPAVSGGLCYMHYVENKNKSFLKKINRKRNEHLDR